MGNICCGYDDEDHKHGAWYDNHDDDNSNKDDDDDDDDDGQYNTEATNREQLIMLHEQNRHISAQNKGIEENCSAVDENGGLKNNGMTRLKRPSITSTPIDMSSSFTFSPPSFPKSPETTEFLLSTLSNNFVFASIGEETKFQFVNAMQSQEFNEGDWVMQQGDVGDYFYIVEEGEVAFHVGEGSPSGNVCENSPQVGTGSRGSSFGELALLYNTPRAASIRALTPLKLYKIDQLTFRSLLMSHQLQDRSNIISLVEKMSVFQDLDEAKLRKLVDAFTIVEFDEGERIVNKGDHGDIFYIVKSGTVKIDDIGHGNSKFKDQLLGKGDCFGERALITGETRAANVTAVEKSSFLVMSKGVLENIIGPLEQAIMNSSHSKYLRSIPFFEGVEQDEIDRCVVYLKEESFGKGDKITGTGKLYLIQEGHALMMLTLSNNFVFASIGEETKFQFVNAMQSQEFNEGDWVMQQGDVGDYFYIVEEGEVAFHVGEGSPSGNVCENSPQVGTGSRGSSFGELALLYNTPRAASIRALTPLKLYKIDQLTFRSLLMSHQLQDRSNIISLVEKMSVFQDLDEAKLRKLVDAFTIVEFDEGERIVNKGDHGDIFYIVKSGTVKIDDIGHGNSKFKDQLLGRGDCFGERALLTGETRAANVTAVEKSSFLVMSKGVLENIIGPLEQAIMNSSHSKYLRSIPFFEGVEQDEIDRCVVYLKEESFEKGDTVMARGKLYLIQEGHALMMLHEKGQKVDERNNKNG
eukprot:CAMPEP_0196159098 /NCGR_PEP_ID=MMETSP0910-20130528/46147_1 /TAXON_ID=49265 /ORGANISM="Thalassiosira rotula, Strain GSO102" /LENGTH=749 /DNA_ID=CAMNT_0041424013 /DNA_START=82 /DNA_END=2328 /DNA_ORIENTATION=-